MEFKPAEAGAGEMVIEAETKGAAIVSE